MKELEGYRIIYSAENKDKRHRYTEQIFVEKFYHILPRSQIKLIAHAEVKYKC